MEPEVIQFLLRIVKTISMGLLWLLLNMTFGIYLGFAFFESQPSPGNYIFYVWFILSLTLLLLYFRNKWKDNLR